jgi:hypothetical protein
MPGKSVDVRMVLSIPSGAVRKPRDLQSRLREAWTDLVDAVGTMNGIGTSLSLVAELP